MSKKNISKFERDIENAISGTKIICNQLKFGILNPKNWKLEYKVFYKNESNGRLKYIVITPRKKPREIY